MPSTPAAPSHPSSTACASAQKGCACVRRAYRLVMSGAAQRSVVDQPYGEISGGVVSASACGCRKERAFTTRKPAFGETCVHVGSQSLVGSNRKTRPCVLAQRAKRGGQTERTDMRRDVPGW